MKKPAPLTSLLLLFLPLLLGSVTAMLTGGIGESYRTLSKPPLSPPGIVFPIVWGILYLLMGISAYLIYRKCLEKEQSLLRPMIPFSAQLLLNICWTFLFFGFQCYLLGSVWVLLMIAAIIWMIVVFYRLSPTAAFLQIPYLLWCCFAAYLSFGVYFLNR